MNELIVKVLNDDRCGNKNLCHSHGLSLYIEFDGKKLLFDVGQDDSFIKNSKYFGLNLNKIDLIVLSHGHYDHTIGLKFLNRKYKVLCHPECTKWRKSKKTGNYNGLPFTEEEFTNKFDVNFCKKTYEISKNILFLGEIERKIDFECKYFPSTNQDGTDDTAIDDSGLSIRTSKGLVVITGCGHSGVCNTIVHAKRISGEDKIYAVIGGFHLKEIDEQVEKTIKFFEENGIENIWLGHCTSDKVCDYFKEKLQNKINVNIIFAGQEIRL